MKPPKSRVTFHVQLDDDVRAQVEKIAEQEDRSINYILRQLISEALAARKGKKK